MTIALLAIGLFAGTLAALLGVGGGIVFVPALVVILGLSQHVAQGTSLAVIAPTALIATIVHHHGGRVAWPIAIPVSIGSAFGAYVGASFALRLEGPILEKLFALVLASLSVLMWVKAGRRDRPTATPQESAPQ
ncbi:MAG: sulfite exporter TauE/SafE family protein [Acidimicrobiales bacterium]